ncbi:MAG: HypC/HybG/HupF family hydrogenase formation chaperone [Nocardioides sp.]|nr:HypC/HybG/HupF family hydrogenase formation chaperone [Nocardioides sp.]
MCLGALAEVVSVGAADVAEVSYDGRHATVSLLALDEPVAVGDWLVVHAGFVLERLTAAEAREAARIRAARPRTGTGAP